MSRFAVGALLCAGLIAMGFSAPAEASVVYTLTFENANGTIVNEGSGTLTLNLSTLAQADNFNSSSNSTFNELATTTIDGQTSFDLHSADLQTFSISTGSTGNVNSLTVEENVPASNNGNPATATDILVLDLFTNQWQIHGTNNSTVDSGRLAISLPALSATPLPATLPLFAGGLGLVGYLTKRRKGNAKHVLAAV
jgi:hypothetical protein